MKKITGVVTALVKSLDDPTHQGKIQLQFPWLSDTQRSSWAPVAAPLSGKSRGAFFMPEIGDEALVAFEHGDVDHPYIVGFLWNGVDVPPESTTKNRVIITPGGHQLRFEDTDGAQKVIVSSNGGHSVTLDDAANSISVNAAAGGSIQLSGGGRQLTLQGGTVQIQ